MARLRIRCSSCQQFHKNRCQLELPECRGPDSIAATECSCYLPTSGTPVFLHDPIALNVTREIVKDRYRFRNSCRKNAIRRLLELRNGTQLALF